MTEFLLIACDLRQTEEGRHHALAQQARWSAATDIPWSQQDISAPAPRLRHALAQIYAGKQVTLSLAGQLLAQASDPPARLCLADLIRDAARHVEALGIYLSQGPPGDAAPRLAPHLTSLCQALLGSAGLEEKLLGIFVLCAAHQHDLFGLAPYAAQDPVLHALRERLTQDQARHLDLGALLLRPRLAAASPKRQRDLDRAARGYVGDVRAAARWRNPDLPLPATVSDADDARRGAALLSDVAQRLGLTLTA